VSSHSAYVAGIGRALLPSVDLVLLALLQVLVELLLGFIVLFLGLLFGVQLGLHLVLFVYLLLLVILILLQLSRRPGRWKWVPRMRQRSRLRPAVRHRRTPAAVS